mmetsp:Transcript_29202/g.93835  ORF Transcript_29202/g.93835 Transcript_29202/m.93835 type:complete len:477 (-) Transcript_29202:141-1571(-)
MGSDSRRSSGKKSKTEPPAAGGVKRHLDSSMLPDVSLATDAVLASEMRFGSKGEELSYYFKDGQRSDGGVGEGGASSGMLKLKRIMYATFLPSGYPASLPDEYTKYQAFNLLQDLSSNLRGILSTQKILEGMGVGKAGVTSLAATMQWMARDGSSMLGGLLFTAFASSSFGIDIKRWRLFADLINDVALLLDMLAPAYPDLFLPIICLSSVFKAMCGVAAGACNTAIVQHWAARGNIADVGAKTGAQHTFVSVLALPMGFLFAQAANSSLQSLWTSFVVLTSIHVWACYSMMRTLALRILTRSQLDRILPSLLFEGSEKSKAISSMTPASLAKTDKLLWLPWAEDHSCCFDLLFGVSLSTILRSGIPLKKLIALFEGEKFMIAQAHDHSRQAKKPKLVICVAEESTPRDYLRAYVTAHLIARELNSSTKPMDQESLIRSALEKMRSSYHQVEKSMTEAGWDLQQVSLGQPAWVGRW